MINNLFRIFDPLTNIINLPLNWTRTLLGLLYFPIKFWIIPNRSIIFSNKISLFLHQEFKTLLGNNRFNGTTFIFISLFFLILINNFLGLFPHIFTATSHLTFSLTFSLPFWIRIIIYGWLNNTNHIFSHLVPLRTPFILIPFIILIETISNIIRPGTLAIRLTANIIAGHLLLTLIRSRALTLSKSLIIILILSQTILLLLEIAVSIIQAYVLVTLRTLYSSEIN